MNSGNDSYEKKLRDLIENTPGAISASLTGTDGIGIAAYNIDASLDPALADAEFATLLATANRAAANLEVGAVEELVLSTGKVIILLRLVGLDFYISIGLQPGMANLGMARLQLRRASQELSDILY